MGNIRDDEQQIERDIRRLEEETEGLEGAERTNGRLLLVIIRQNIFQIKAVADLASALASQGKVIDKILADLEPSPLALSAISIRFGGNMAVGPVTLSQATPNTVATVLGFDQFGNAFPLDFTVNPVTYTLDDPSQDTLAANADGSANLTWLTPGGKTANLTATCAGFSDTEQINNIAVVVPPPVLSSIKVDFSTPTA